MNVTFDVALDGGGWAGPFADADFLWGEAWVGPLGLLDLLERRLGLRGRAEPPLARVCRLVARLRTESGEWRRSYDVDPLSTCRRLLYDRDLLVLWGWSGQAVSPRLAELQAATQDAGLGLGDRLWAVGRALAGRARVIDALVSHTAIEHLAPAWRAVFEALRRAGTSVEVRRLPPAPAVGDLALARSPGFRPSGDGRLCLLRRHGPLEVADEVAASLAACDGLDGVVVVGADAVLDRALARHGLPQLGADAATPSSARLLRLVLEAAFHPMEMADLHALLAADPGPIPRRIAGPLLGALREHPARDGEFWRTALARGLARFDEGERAAVEAWVTALLAPACGRDTPLPVPALRARFGALRSWALARAAYAPTLQELAVQAKALLDAVELLGEEALSRHALRRLCDDLGEAAWCWRPAQAGLAHVASPAAILGPARAIVWWSFSRDAATRPQRLLLMQAEREGLRAAGVEPPDPVLQMTVEAAGWWRPLLQAREALVLACPLVDDAGEPNHPHPLWDDVTANLEDFRQARRLERDELVYPAVAAKAPVASRPLVTPAPEVTVPRTVELRERESPSSLEQLIGCSLSWTLRYHGRLGAGLAAGPDAPGPLLYGKVAHHLLEQVVKREPVDPDRAAALAAALFDEQCGAVCEALALPQFQAARASVKRVVVESARALAELAAKHGARGVQPEVDVELSALGRRVVGRADVVWEDPAVVLDLKWGKRSQAARMEAGVAIQLAAYGAMRGAGVETAYFVLNTQEVLAEPGGRLAADAALQGLSRSPETWTAALATAQARIDALAAGRLEAPGAEGGEIKPASSPGELRVAPPCDYCSFSALCGRGGGK